MLAAAATAAPAHAAAGAAAQGFDRHAALEASQAAVGRPVGDYRFTDGDGRGLRLAELRGRPLVLSLVYTSCAHTCPLLTEHLARMVAVAREALGAESFTVLTVGFDTAVDSPARMRLFARERGIDTPHWRFLSTDAASAAALARDVGFLFTRRAGGYDHLTQTTVLDAQGRVYRQIYGSDFEPPALVEPLKQLVFGARAEPATLDGWLNGVRLFCTVYDPASGRYRFDYSLFVGAAVGLLSLGAVAAFVVRAWRGSRTPPPAF